MAGTKITYTEKVTLQEQPVATPNKFTSGDANEVRDVVNKNRDDLDELADGAWRIRSPYNASGGAYPSSGGTLAGGGIAKGNAFPVSTYGDLPAVGGGTIGAPVGSVLLALVNNPGQTPANWRVL